jgi:hypothetical protein
MIGSLLFGFMVNSIVGPDIRELDAKISDQKRDTIPTSWKHSDHF